MRREVPMWLAIVVVAVVVGLIGLIYFWRWQQAPSIPPEVQEQIEAGKAPPIRRVPKR
ncbi:hypothetical protein HRbin17_02593 [bacterium HR17]|uniref:Uncharacterized protein n=1 Tax=Candidatus Fervidibacter japonicus TaxID=2035412 RepID=A0A2H5XFV0_9BACT|nr:hypothetical protein HRbin17_02593 [bacterium HR17]